MKLLKSLKQKKRYILFEINEEVPLADLKKSVDESLLSFLGQLGLAKASPLFVKAQGKRFIMKVNHKFVEECVSALILIKKIKNDAIIIKSVITSGTLKKASEKLS